MKKWLIGVVSSVILVPTIVLCWGNIKAIWAAPASIATVDKKVDDLTELVKEQGQTQKQLADLVVGQNHRIEKNEAVTAVQIKALEKIVDKLETRK